jgi:DNA-binding CsgD family transcriptional regulator
MRQSDPGKALELWRALVRGRWSAVDWFDSDGRRYVLGIPNAPGITDPRGLTDREMQVLNYALLGMSNKLVAYHLGLSSGRVSTLLSSVMRKFKVRTRSELIKVLSDFGPLTEY